MHYLFDIISVLVIASNSMSPTLKTGDLVVIQKPAQSPKLNSIITYKSVETNKLMTHRLVSIKIINGVNLYITKGDANSFEDPNPLAYQEVLGEVAVIIPYAGFMLNPETGVLVGLTFLGFCLGYVLKQLFLLS